MYRLAAMSDFAMTVASIRCWGTRLLVGCALVHFATQVPAQVVGNRSQLPSNGQAILPLPGPITGGNLTPQQMQSIMMMRALSGRGRHGVQTGFPQIIGMGNSGFGGAPVQLQSPPQPKSTRKTSAQKRAETRKLRDDQKHAVRQDEKSKKGKAAKKAHDGDQQEAAK
ncbi:MAG: hypothetical protein HY288_03685 [Planctomycetia bacterium]|nr:hypothetical protein [Planctomycetia bacterium]